MFGVKGFDPVTLRKPSCDLWERHGLLRELDGTLDPRAAFGELCLNVKGARLSQIYRKLDSSKPAYTITGSALTSIIGRSPVRLPIASVHVCRPSPTTSSSEAPRSPFASRSAWPFPATALR